MASLIILVGISGSGKSSLAEKYKRFFTHYSGIETLIVSSAEIRAQELGNINDQTQNEKVFSIVHKTIKENIDTKNVIVDATNITYKSRKAILNCVKKKTCKKEAIVMATPIKVCKERNQNRDRVVPENVIEKQANKFEIPFYEEGYDDIFFYDYQEENFKFFKLGWNLNKDEIFKEMVGFDQKNSHHIYTLDQHCLRTTLELVRPKWKIWNESTLIRAATIHDIGKMFTGEPKDDGTGNWKYYGHMNRGTYYLLSEKINLLGFNNKNDILECLFYINYHMEPFFWLSKDKKTGEEYISEKTKKKMLEKFGENKYYKLKLFNLCDKIGSGTYRGEMAQDKKELELYFNKKDSEYNLQEKEIELKQDYNKFFKKDKKFKIIKKIKK